MSHRRRLSRWIDSRRGIVFRTKTGKPLRQADIEALADEAEQGYDVSRLVSRPDPLARGQLLIAAASAADGAGLCFVHLHDDDPPSYAVLTAERYRELTGRLFDGDIPVGDPEWQHTHMTPELLEAQPRAFLRKHR